MNDWSADRAAMLTALEPSLGAELVAVFDERLPARRWREWIPSEHWLRPEVRDAMSDHSQARRHLHESLIALLGAHHAGTLMEYLVPAPWAVLARLGVPVSDLLAAPYAA